jgi:hypothetical protein
MLGFKSGDRLEAVTAGWINYDGEWLGRNESGGNSGHSSPLVYESSWTGEEIMVPLRQKPCMSQSGQGDYGWYR